MSTLTHWQEYPRGDQVPAGIYWKSKYGGPVTLATSEIPFSSDGSHFSEIRKPDPPSATLPVGVSEDFTQTGVIHTVIVRQNGHPTTVRLTTQHQHTPDAQNVGRVAAQKIVDAFSAPNVQATPNHHPV